MSDDDENGTTDAELADMWADASPVELVAAAETDPAAARRVAMARQRAKDRMARRDTTNE